MTQSEPYQRPVVLIIDDEKLSRKMLSQVLEQSGYQVIEAESGQTGLAQFKTHSPDLVLLDLMMPDMDGYAVCEALRKLQCYQSLPILMLTGLNDVESVNHAFRVGATDFITKPINWPLLGERVNLLTNAIKFSPEQSTINISLQSTDTQMSVFIEDQGPGITDGFRQRIFQKFAQGDSSDTRKYGGTGLGLYICKQIIEGMHGSIDYSNQAEGGAVFFFSLPKKQPQ